ncbi:hypothetical protein Y032_0243g3481 [Ancylostoma ceylanicum]|nr:hypothetical protein Y032_0243g3481 [Ancylostoma ceylanicum]
MARPAIGLSLSLGPRSSILRAACQPLRSCGKIVSNCSRPEETNCWHCRDAVNCTKKFFCERCKLYIVLTKVKMWCTSARGRWVVCDM